MSATATRFARVGLLLAVCAIPHSAAVTQSAPEISEAATRERLAMLSFVAADTRSRDRTDRPGDASIEAIKIKQLYPNLGTALGLEAQVERELLKVIAQYTVQPFERSLQRSQVVGLPDSNVIDGEPPELAITRLNAAVKQLLGSKDFWRYHAYMRTLAQRNQIRTLTELLPSDPLQPEQLEQMVQVLADHDEELSYLSFRAALHPEPSTPRDEQQMFEYRQALHQQLLRRTAQILDVHQQSVFASLQATQLDAQRRLLGVKSSTHAARSTRPAGSGELSGIPLRWRLQLRVNHAPAQTLAFKGVSGHAESFATPEGLRVQATPVLDEERALRVRLKVFEADDTGRHFIGNLYGSGEWQPAAEEFAYSQSAVLSGSRGYAMSLAVAAVQ